MNSFENLETSNFKMDSTESSVSASDVDSVTALTGSVNSFNEQFHQTDIKQ